MCLETRLLLWHVYELIRADSVPLAAGPNTGSFDDFWAETSPGPVRLILSFGWDEHCQKNFTTSSYRTNRMLALSTTSYD